MRSSAFVKKSVLSLSALILLLLFTVHLGAQQAAEKEPNDERGRANRIDLNKEVEGFAGEDRDEEWFALTIPEPGLELKVHIVGFDIKEKESRAQLESIAESTNGMYLDAQNAGELMSALEQTLQVEYQVLNEKGQEVARGTVGGEEVKLEEGTYTIRIMLAPQSLETKITVKPGEKAVCVLKKEAESWKLGC